MFVAHGNTKGEIFCWLLIHPLRDMVTLTVPSKSASQSERSLSQVFGFRITHMLTGIYIEGCAPYNILGKIWNIIRICPLTATCLLHRRSVVYYLSGLILKAIIILTCCFSFLHFIVEIILTILQILLHKFRFRREKFYRLFLYVEIPMGNICVSQRHAWPTLLIFCYSL
jgi:hypothetical protein